jgi:membrane associated rhomboid family serine protease
VSLLAVAVTAMTLTGRWPMERFEVDPTAFRSEPWRLLTSALPHLDLPHLVFNVYWLWVFGTLLEEVLGHARLLGIIALFAVGSAAAEYAMTNGGVGLSGVGYGLFGLLWVLSSRSLRFKGAVDARTAQLFGVWFVFCVVTTHLGVMPVGNFAHGGGAVLGALLGYAMSERTPAARRVAAAAGVPVLVVASLLGATVLRPRVNLAHDGSASFQLGYDAIQAGRFDDAIRHFHDSVAMNEKDAKAWYNLGIACDSAHRSGEAAAAYRHAYDLDTHSLRYRHAYEGVALRAANEAEEGGDHAGAAAILGDLVQVDPDDTAAWLLLERCDRALGRTDDAERARARAEKARLAAPR